jgi:uncharacterized protein (DUF1015 family)
VFCFGLGLESILMASIKPFRALRPKTELEGDICELPYDEAVYAKGRELRSID